MPNRVSKGKELIKKEAEERRLEEQKKKEEIKAQKEKEFAEKFTIIDGKKYVEIDGELKVYNTNNEKTTRLERLNEYGLVFNQRGKPKKMITDLIEQYVAEGKEAQLAGNTIIDLVEKDILKYKKAIDNMVEFGDFNVFKTVPHQLLKECESYGLVAQDYSKKKIEAMAGTEIMVVPVNYSQCRKCKKFRSERYFYVCDSEFSDGLTPICKECAIEIFLKVLDETEDIKEALMVTFSKMDLVIDIDILEDIAQKFSEESMETSLRNGAIIGEYIKRIKIDVMNLNISGYDNSFVGSNFGNSLFKNIQRKCKTSRRQICKTVSEENNKDNIDAEIEEMYENMSKQKINVLRSKWGNISIEDLKFLENKYNRWFNTCEINGGSTEALLIQICFEELNIFKARQDGKSDVSKMVKTYQELLKSANLTPKQQSAITQTSEFASLADFIKKSEQTKPIISRNKEYDDINGFEKQGRVLAGCVARTLGKTNEYVQEFEEAHKDDTIDFVQMSDENG